jgi:hypothetical protein
MSWRENPTGVMNIGLKVKDKNSKCRTIKTKKTTIMDEIQM